jgi:hypothetical protein
MLERPGGGTFTESAMRGVLSDVTVPNASDGLRPASTHGRRPGGPDHQLADGARHAAQQL